MEDSPRPDLLNDILVFLRVEGRETQRILEIPERIFLVPYADILEMPIFF